MKTQADYEMYGTVNRFTTLVIICASFLFAGLAIIFWTQMGNRQISYTNQAYQKTSLCIFSVPPAQHGIDDIDRCYKEVQEKTGLSIERYSN